jgi:hypothetical protein
MKDRGIRNTNFKEGDVVRWGYDASTGQVTMAYGQGGAQMQHFDFSETKTGFRNTTEALNITDKGERITIGIQQWTGGNIRSENIDTWDVKRGPATPEAMWNAAITNSLIPAIRISSSVTNRERVKEETTQADQFARALASRVSSTGMEISHTEAEGRGSISLKTSDLMGLSPVQASATGNVSIGRRNLEEHNYNIYQGIIRRFQGERNINVRTLGEKHANEIYTERLHDLAKGTDELVKGRTEFSFGASAVVGEPYERAKNLLNEATEGKQDDSSSKGAGGSW